MRWNLLYPFFTTKKITLRIITSVIQANTYSLHHGYKHAYKFKGKASQLQCVLYKTQKEPVKNRKTRVTRKYTRPDELSVWAKSPSILIAHNAAKYRSKGLASEYASGNSKRRRVEYTDYLLLRGLWDCELNFCG